MNSAEALTACTGYPGQERGLGACGVSLCLVPQLCFNFFIVGLCLELLFQLLGE